MEGKIVKSTVYYSPHRQQAFEVPLHDKDGEEMLQKDRFNNLILGRGARPVVLSRMEKFKTLIDSPKLGYQCVYNLGWVIRDGKEVPVDNDVFLQLEKLADDPATKVIREETYKASVNPTAYKLEVEVREKDRVIEQLQAQVATANQASSDAVQSMQKEMAELKTMLEEQTKPPAGAAEQDVKRGPGRPRSE